MARESEPVELFVLIGGIVARDGMMDEQKITRRMKWIVRQMRERGAVIGEHRDAFLEKSWWELHTPDYSISQEIAEKTRVSLIQAGLIQSLENRPVYRDGKLVTSENIYGLK